MSATRQRDHADQVAKTNTERALAECEKISDPWFCCQALASALRYAPEDQVKVIDKRAQMRAAECADDYCRSAVLAWLIRVLAERDYVSDAEAVLSSAIKLASHASPAGSRAEALFLLFQAAYPLGSRMIAPLVDQLLRLNIQSPHWRCSRAFISSVAMLFAIVPDDCERILAALTDQRLIRRTRRAISLGLTCPRSFF